MLQKINALKYFLAAKSGIRSDSKTAVNGFADYIS